MVKKYPPTLEELRKRREEIPKQEESFYNMVDDLDDSWYVWHSINWDNDVKMISGEADFLIFHPNYGYIVMEVKGGTISVQNGIFYSTNQLTLECNAIKDPFDQARNCMHHIREFYIDNAEKSSDLSELLKYEKFFPLSFNYGVFFPDCAFKNDFEYLQLNFNKIFDQIDCEKQMEWMGSGREQKSPLEKFFIDLLDAFKHWRVHISGTSSFFIKMIGSNISNYVTIRKYLDLREIELEEVNKVQDFLLNSLSEKRWCIFRGSAGSGKTFIAMKKALLNFKKGIKTLVLCFNAELRDSIQEYFCKQINKRYEEFQDKLQVHTINSFLRLQITESYYGNICTNLLNSLNNFKYAPIATSLKADRSKIYKEYKYDAIIVDEAQDIDKSLWNLFECFLNDAKNSILYIFYDEAQAIFVEDFSIAKFGMDPEKDLIILTRNLRNTIEIAHWLKDKTELGEYQDYSGIRGFKITKFLFPNSHEALMRALSIVKSKYYDKNISLNRIAILSYYKLKNLISRVDSNEFCDYTQLYGKKQGSKERMFIIEPNHISNLQDVSKCDDIKSDFLILFKTISGFKGLERDVIFVIVPQLDEFKQRYPERYENFIMQIYIGASRARFKLYFFEYSL